MRSRVPEQSVSFNSNPLPDSYLVLQCGNFTCVFWCGSLVQYYTRLPLIPLETAFVFGSREIETSPQCMTIMNNKTSDATKKLIMRVTMTSAKLPATHVYLLKGTSTAVPSGSRSRLAHPLPRAHQGARVLTLSCSLLIAAT